MRKYIIYGGSILFSKGLEYLVLLLAPFYLSKEEYGGMEFYRRVIQIGTAIFSFGLPTLILSYPRSDESKKYFTLISLFFISCLIILTAPFLSFSTYIIFLVPIYFHSIFFNTGIIPPFVLTSRGSNSASIYKIFVSLLFYLIVIISLFFLDEPEYTFVYVGYILLPIFLIFSIWYFHKKNIYINKLKRYWKLFRKLLISSFTIVISNFSSMMFLYTDILIIKILSKSPKIEIANYSFSLNIANALLLVPLTLIQVDIEKLKTKDNYAKYLNKKIVIFVLIFSLLLTILFLILTNNYFIDYKSTYWIFAIILIAKIIQSFSLLSGAQIIIKKKFSGNLNINLISLMVNIILSYILYYFYGLLGVAFASLISLMFRYLMLININKKP